MRVNLFSGPGAGKSTLASGLFSEFKKKNYSIELVHEYIKKWAYEGRKPKSFDQVYIFGHQLHAEDSILQSGVKNLITDSPLFMQCSYAIKYNFPCWQELLGIAKEFEKQFPSLNIFLDRKGIPYQDLGRYETEEEALAMDEKIKSFMDMHLDYIVIQARDYRVLMRTIERHLDE